MRFGLLGPAAAWQDGRETELGSPQQRTVFALLLLHRNTVVSTDRMVDVLWPAGPPANALQVLRTYVSRLRGLGIAELVTHRQGYELRGEADADHFESLLAAAREELDTGAAEALLTEALALVRGAPLPELADDHLAGVERERLDEVRTAAEEELADRRLAQGRHRELVPALQAAVAAEPLRERSWGQLMVALYRCGRQTDALAAYRAAQRALAELGLEPSPQLRELERMVLLQDAALEPAPEAKLPRYRTSFVGPRRRARGGGRRAARAATAHARRPGRGGQDAAGRRGGRACGSAAAVGGSRRRRRRPRHRRGGRRARSPPGSGPCGRGPHRRPAGRAAGAAPARQLRARRGRVRRAR